jgi:hypothetical protein
MRDAEESPQLMRGPLGCSKLMRGDMRSSRAAAPLFVLLWSACVTRDEVARVRSPGGKVEAVLVETNGGATTSFGYNVSLSAVGRRHRVPVASFDGAARSEQAYGVNLVWRDTQHLTIEYLVARYDTLLRDSVRLADQNVFVRLRPGIIDSTAPRGGMLYNLERARREQR